MKRPAEEYYDTLADQYDVVSKGKFNWTPPSELEQLTAPLLKPGITVLDIGSGTGQTLRLAHSTGARIIAVDISENMLSVLERKFRGVKTLKDDLESGAKSLGSKTFHIVQAIGVLEFCENFKSSLQRLAELTEDGGYLVFTFEEHIEGHPIQGQRSSLTGEGAVKPPTTSKLMHFRHQIAEVAAMIKGLGVRPVSSKRFQAYLKSEKLIPIYYTICLYQKVL